MVGQTQGLCADCWALAGTWQSTTLAARIPEALHVGESKTCNPRVPYVFPVPPLQHCPHALTAQFICQQNYARRSDYPT